MLFHQGLLTLSLLTFGVDDFFVCVETVLCQALGPANVRKRHTLNSGACHIPMGEICTDVSGVGGGGGVGMCLMG